MADIAKRDGISVNSKVTVGVRFAGSNRYGKADINAEIEVNFGSNRPEFTDQLDKELAKLRTKILICSGLALREDQVIESDATTVE